jgi:hypothetical protein
VKRDVLVCSQGSGVISRFQDDDFSPPGKRSCICGRNAGVPCPRSANGINLGLAILVSSIDNASPPLGAREQEHMQDRAGKSEMEREVSSVGLRVAQ